MNARRTCHDWRNYESCQCGEPGCQSSWANRIHRTRKAQRVNDTFTDLAVGRRLLDAMREEKKNTQPDEPRPAYVDWVVWARNNAEHLIDTVEALANRLDQATNERHLCAKDHADCEQAETRTEWGVRRPPRFNSTIAWMTSRREAESFAASWDNGSKVVSRTVYVGPWTEAQS